MEDRRDNSQIMHGLGELTGAVHAMHQGLTARIEDIKADIRRLEEAQSERMDRIEDSLGRRIDNLEVSVGRRIDHLGTRVTNLEEEDKRLIDKTARLGAIGGGVGGALAAGLVEVIKRIS
jgi:predicted PurR-regulated permease PerM